MEFLANLVKLVLGGALLLLVCLISIALISYNKLQHLAQNVKEKASNVQIAISKKLSLINQMIDVVRNYQEGEQFTYLKISQDSSASSLMNAYQQSGNLYSTLQGVADRFPNLKASEQYHRLMDNIQQCEVDIQNSRHVYNNAVKNYNMVCLAIPAVFVARFIGFSSAPFLAFDLSGANDVTSLKEFKTDDGERLQQLLASAGGHITRSFTAQTTQVRKMLGNKAKPQEASLYFYMLPGEVPRGPSSLQAIHEMVSRGDLAPGVLVAESGSSDWKSVDAVAQEGDGESV